MASGESGGFKLDSIPLDIFPILFHFFYFFLQLLSVPIGLKCVLCVSTNSAVELKLRVISADRLLVHYDAMTRNKKPSQTCCTTTSPNRGHLNR